MISTICNRAIEYLFYALFFFVPLFFLPVNSELFEFNKMLLTYALTIAIGGFWVAKMIGQGRIVLKRTPIDIPIFLFLVSQIISTVFSIDIHTSIWGYYSRSNGGLASILSYIFLYYAFVSNFDTLKTKRLLVITLVSGTLVAMYGVLERLGIDKDFWIQDVQNRVFSTLGQPNWLAAYLSVLIPIAIALGLQKTQNTQKISKSEKSVSQNVRYSDSSESPTNRVIRVFWTFFPLILVVLFYVTLLFTKSRSGFLGLVVSLVFFLSYLWKFQRKFLILNSKFFILTLASIGSITFLFGAPFEQLNRFTLDGIRSQPHSSPFNLHPSAKPQGPALEVGGTESGEIRKIVWKGAIDIAKAYPLFGSGVETFAYSYYRFRPIEHNMTSEWDFLYNKAHNEYLNYLANTGFVGLGAYLLMIGVFIVLCIKHLVLSLKKEIHNTEYLIVTTGILAGYVSILVSNFFGFSVVVTNLYLFLIPAFVFTLTGMIDSEKVFALPIQFWAKRTSSTNVMNRISNMQWLGILAVLLISYFSLFYLYRMWDADRNFALGENYNREGEYTLAYPRLFEALQKRASEPQFADELSTTTAMLALSALKQNETTLSAQRINESVKLSNLIIAKSPNNPNFWRSRVRVFYTLAQIDESYYEGALAAAKKASELSPTDPKIAYNYGLILGQLGKLEEAIAELERTVALKPDYRDGVYALGLFYHKKATDEKVRVVSEDFLKRAIAQMEEVLKLASDDAEAKDRLKEWRGLP